MAKRRRTRQRKFNPTGLETGLMVAGAVVIGGIGGFVLASYACGKLLQASYDTGVIEPGPFATVEGVMGSPAGRG